jgi:hypothetical protein
VRPLLKKKKPSWAAVTERLAVGGAAQQKGGLAVSVGIEKLRGRVAEGSRFSVSV